MVTREQLYRCANASHEWKAEKNSSSEASVEHKNYFACLIQYTKEQITKSLKPQAQNKETSRNSMNTCPLSGSQKSLDNLKTNKHCKQRLLLD
jgi:hypothetical protein